MQRSLVFLLMMTASVAQADFVDSFDGARIDDGWTHYTGDGSATMTFTPQNGHARIAVDATNDPHNVWWAIIKRDVAGFVDLEKLQDPAYELRVEARVRGSHAPRRVNFMINTQRTTDYHEHLREYDLPDTGWHTISMTTDSLDVRPGDALNVQLGVTDWGPGRYHVDVDYYKAEVVRREGAKPDVGEPLVYHPPVPALDDFKHHLDVTHDSVISVDFPNVNFNDWRLSDGGGSAAVLTVTAAQWPVLRWDFGSRRDQKARGPGILEVTAHSVAKGGRYAEPYGEDLGVEFGKIRVIEVLNGDPDWTQEAVTFRSLLAGGTVEEVFNTQMIFDHELETTGEGQNFITLSRPVMQRLLDGRTKGLVLRPLGAIAASIYASEDPAGRGPKLHFNLEAD